MTVSCDPDTTRIIESISIKEHVAPFQVDVMVKQQEKQKLKQNPEQKPEPELEAKQKQKCNLNNIAIEVECSSLKNEIFNNNNHCREFATLDQEYSGTRVSVPLPELDHLYQTGFLPHANSFPPAELLRSHSFPPVDLSRADSFPPVDLLHTDSLPPTDLFESFVKFPPCSSPTKLARNQNFEANLSDRVSFNFAQSVLCGSPSLSLFKSNQRTIIPISCDLPMPCSQPYDPSATITPKLVNPMESLPLSPPLTADASSCSSPRLNQESNPWTPPVLALPKTRKMHSASSQKNRQKACARGLSCHNCHTTSTPLWRRTDDKQFNLCNACGLYNKQYKADRPLHNKAVRVDNLDGKKKKKAKFTEE